ncbi:MAG TPA: hypothetical protein PKY29_01350 [Ferruginibacter sp.]|nr:hypothetical protein [Ferruginibacter sp.]HRO16565.1 hypothetical protein [Ferruginibacter sp.]HRQ19926.1 hypothetical protein [Ferruginibacter sp.]
MQVSNSYIVRDNKIKLDDSGQNFLVLFMLFQLFFFNGVYLFFGAIVFGMILINLQRPYKPSVFSLLFVFHFIQISAGIWLSNYLGFDINYRSPNTGLAIILSYIGLMVLMIPVIYYNNRVPNFSMADLKRYAAKLNIKKVFIAYILAFFITNAMSVLAFSFLALTQVILSLVKVKWFLFVLFGFLAILRKNMLRVFIACCVGEFLAGFFSFFSEFKDVVFYASCILITLISTIRLRDIMITIIGIILAAYLGIFWTSIKDEYRAFLNQGSKSQTVQVSEEEAFNKLLDLVQQGRDEYKDDPTANFLDRLQYTYHFAKTIERVPANIPFQYGDNWGETMSYALTPRMLNPDKPIFEATVKTRKYTGLAYAGHRQGASFSLGYFADSYIDFGMFGMFIPLLILGLFYGRTYYYFVRKSSPNILFNYAVVCAIFMEFIAYEVDSTKLVGRLFATLLTFFLLQIFFFPWLHKYFSIIPAKAPDERKSE